MNKWDCIRLRSFCAAKEAATRLKKQLTEWKKIFRSNLYNKGLTSRIYRELKKLSPQGINILMN
jgi:hypothetical protein